MLRVDRLEIRRGDFHLGPLNYQFNSGSLILVRGPNGSGKTSFLKTIVGRMKPSAGSLIAPKPMGAVGLESFLIGTWTPDQNADFFSKLCGQVKPEWSDELKPWAKKRVDHLSSGFKRRVELELVLGLSFDVYLFDEPFNTLDQKNRELLARRLDDLKSKGKIVLISTHGHEELLSKPDQVVEFK